MYYYFMIFINFNSLTHLSNLLSSSRAPYGKINVYCSSVGWQQINETRSRNVKFRNQTLWVTLTLN